MKTMLMMALNILEEENSTGTSQFLTKYEGIDDKIKSQSVSLFELIFFVFTGFLKENKRF